MDAAAASVSASASNLKQEETTATPKVNDTKLDSLKKGLNGMAVEINSNESLKKLQTKSSGENDIKASANKRTLRSHGTMAIVSTREDPVNLDDSDDESLIGG